MVIFMMTFIKQHSCDDFACENELYCRYCSEHEKHTTKNAKEERFSISHFSRRYELTHST